LRINVKVRNAFQSPVLDVGCGVGRVARALLQFLDGGSYIGIDTCRSSIEWCTAYYSDRDNFRFFHADVFSTVYNPNSSNTPDKYRFPIEGDSIDFTVYSFAVARRRQLLERNGPRRSAER
jgi:SAM-dependent methyltransferase